MHGAIPSLCARAYRNERDSLIPQLYNLDLSPFTSLHTLHFLSHPLGDRALFRIEINADEGNLFAAL